MVGQGRGQDVDAGRMGRARRSPGGRRESPTPRGCPGSCHSWACRLHYTKDKQQQQVALLIQADSNMRSPFFAILRVFSAPVQRATLRICCRPAAHAHTGTIIAARRSRRQQRLGWRVAKAGNLQDPAGGAKIQRTPHPESGLPLHPLVGWYSQ